MIRRKLMLVSAAALIAGCAADVRTQQVGETHAELQTIPEVGMVPFPVQIDAVSMKPKLGPDGASLVSAWNLGVPDLLAADAYAECATTSWDYQNYPDLGGAVTRYADSYLETLRSQMGAATCPGASPVPTTPETIWLERRKRALCNVDTRGLTPRAVALATSRDMTGYNTFTPAANAYWGLSASTTTVRDSIFRRASRHLGQADVNLCMALKLRGQLENPQSLFLSADDQKNLLRIIADRSAHAITDLSLIAKTAVSTDPLPATVTAESQYLVGLRKWLDAAPRSRILQDLASAVKLHGAVMLDTIALYRREASARTVPVAASTLAAADFGSLSARNRMMQSLNADPTQYYLLNWWDDADFQNVSVKDPLVGVLLGLSRMPLGGNPPGQINTTWDSNYMATESTLRFNECKSNCAPWPSAPPVTDFRNYELYKKFGITPEHAKDLAAAMAYWGRNQYVLGNHVNGNTDQNFKILDKSPPLLQGRLPWVPRSILFSATPEAQGIGVPVQAGAVGGRTFIVGGVQALAYAREALFDWAPKFPTGVDATTLSGALAELSRLIGDRTVIFRRQKLTAVDEALRTVSVLTKTADPYNRLIQFNATSTLYRGFEAALLDPGSTSLSGIYNRAYFDAMSRVTPTILAASATGPAAGLEMRSFNFTAASSSWLNIALTEAAAGVQNYAYLAELPSEQGALPSPVDSALLVSGGEIGRLVARTFARSPADRSRPAYDAFDFPTDWVPPADASLVGGYTGQESYTYYLDAADKAAAEASSAVQQAIDSLLQQATDEVSVSQAEQQAKQIALLETRNLCGPATSCDVAVTRYQPVVTVPGCTGRCDLALTNMRQVLNGVNLAQLVVGEPDDSPESFSQFEGGEMQRVLLRQLNAKKMLSAALDQAGSLAFAYDKSVTAAESALALAVSDQTAAQADADAAIAGLNQQQVDIAADIASLKSQVADLNSQIKDARDEQATQCSDAAYVQAFNAGYSATKADDFEADDLASDGYGGSKLKRLGDGYSFSPAAYIQQEQACAKAWRELIRIEGNMEPLQAMITAKCTSLINRRGDYTQAQRDAIEAHREAADEKLAASQAAEGAAVQGAYAQLSNQTSQVQAALGELRAASAELSAVKLRSQNSASRAALEADLTSSTNATRWGLTNRYRSYDLWRARAMLENARRLAVAARKAIESRFVVDLSELDAPQTFVAAPSTWADSVYENDLSPPSSVGRTAAPADKNGVYANKLTDYVNNLRLFVQGYTVTYPTSVAAPDTEVLTLPGPDQHFDLESSAGQGLEQEAKGWSFYCPESDSWIAHPGANELPMVSQLGTACDGKRPTQARYQFTIDPWGRLNGDQGQKPLAFRHNVRWRQLAVNLIGTGIRNCEASLNPQQCYSDSFLRFDLSHAGPAWAANYAESWRSIDMPTAFVEGGKALTLEEWLDPVNISWSSSFVSNVARAEFLGRPVSGAYALTIELPDDVVFSRIQSVQILAESDYWVAQH